MQSRMTYREFKEWQAFYRLEPWGEWIEDMRSARRDMMFANAHRGKNKDVYPLKDFLFDWSGMLEAARQAALEEEENGGGGDNMGVMVDWLERQYDAQQEELE